MGRESAIKRTKVIIFFIILISISLIIQLYLVQVVKGEYYKEQANRQYSRPSENIYDRGTIFFQDKDGNKISAATLKSGFIVAINPSILEDAKTTYEELSKLITIDADTFFARASKKTDPYEEIAKHIPENIADKISDLDIDGLNIYKDKWRFYPGDQLAGSVLGFVGFKGDVFAGRYGLEKKYEDTLSRGNNDLYMNFFAEIFSGITGAIERRSVTREGDIVTTIEPTVESFLEETINLVNEKWDSSQTMGIIMNPKTGAIYAMAVNPSFDPNNFGSEKSISIFSNPIVERVYEMGSIIKPITMASGLDSGVINPDTTYNDKGFLILNGSKISNYDGKGRGVVPMQQILSQSLNTGASFISLELGHDKVREYFKNFGFGEKTGIDLPNEVSGLVSNLESSRDLEYATAAFGQGIALTPLMTARALSVLGNGGKLVTPYIVKNIEYEIGFSKDQEYPEPIQVIKPETSEEITRMLVEVVDKALLGGTVKLDNYSIAAKTGTAQIASPDGGYYTDRNLHSFFGYFPAYDPEFLVFLMTIRPVGAKYASQTLTHPFMNIAKFLINYYEVPPDR